MTTLLLTHLTNQLITDYQNAKQTTASLYPFINEGRYTDYRQALHDMLDALELVELYGLQQQAGVRYFNVWD